MLGKSLMREMAAQGIEIHDHVVPAAVRRSGPAQDAGRGGWTRVRRASIACFGRSGATPMSQASIWKQAGVAADDGGFIVTDGFQNTNVPGIYAIGDVTGRAP